MSKKRDRLNKTANISDKPDTPADELQHHRDFSIDLAGIHYGLDSDEIDTLEEHYARLGAPLVTPADYRLAFDAYRFATRSELPRGLSGGE
jgi:hypothetical protein